MWRVTGQDRAVSLLRLSLEAGSVSHAYLFVASAHSGKMTLALDLAAALNCEGEEPPCGQCDSCQKVYLLKHADIQVIGIGDDDGSGEAKSRMEISIDQIRQVQHSANLPPFEGKYKVFIIDGAESLSMEAANALLKTLEEPEGSVVFILLTTDSGLLPETVVSRCQTVEFAPVPDGEVEAVLKQSRGVEPDKARMLAKLARGRLGWALSAVQDESILGQRAEWLDEIQEVIAADSERKFAYSSQLSSRFSQDRELVYGRLELWLDWWRDLMLVKTDAAESVTNIDRLEELGSMAGRYSLAQIRNFIRGIQAADEQLKQNANPRLVLDVLMLDIPGAGRGKEVVASDKR